MWIQIPAHQYFFHKSFAIVHVQLPHFFCSIMQEWEKNGVTQHIFTTVDFVPPTIDDIKEGLKIINKARSNKYTVYIHCKGGRGRSAVMTTCYLISVSSKYTLIYNCITVLITCPLYCLLFSPTTPTQHTAKQMDTR